MKCPWCGVKLEIDAPLINALFLIDSLPPKKIIISNSRKHSKAKSRNLLLFYTLVAWTLMAYELYPVQSCCIDIVL